MALFRQCQEKLKQQSTVTNQNTKDNLKILFRIVSTLQSLLHSYIHVTAHCMPAQQYTSAEYALQLIVNSLGNLLFQLEDHHSTNTNHVVIQLCELENIDYLVLQYLHTGALRFEEFSEEGFFNSKVLSSSILETDISTISIWQLLQPRCGQEVESWNETRRESVNR